MNALERLRNLSMKTLTVRGIPLELAQALRREKERRGVSINQIALELLSTGLGLQPGQPRSNGLAALAGSWTLEDVEAFESATAMFEQIDRGVWH